MDATPHRDHHIPHPPAFEDDRSLRALLLRAERDPVSERLLGNLSRVTRALWLARRAHPTAAHA